MSLDPIERNSCSQISLKEGEVLHVNPGKAQAWVGTEISTEFSAGFIESIKRILWNAATIFRNIFTCTSSRGGWVLVEESNPGALEKYNLTQGRGIKILKDKWIASTEDVALESEFVGLKGLFSNTGLAMVHASLKADAINGKVFFNTDHGIIRRIELNPENGPVTVDNDAIIAYTDGLSPTFTHAGDGVKSYVFGGENLVCKFQGTGSIFISSVPHVEKKPKEVHHHHHSESRSDSSECRV